MTLASVCVYIKVRVYMHVNNSGSSLCFLSTRVYCVLDFWILFISEIHVWGAELFWPLVSCVTLSKLLTGKLLVP